MKSKSPLKLEGKIAVLGLGKSGNSAISLLRHLGAANLVSFDQFAEANYSDGEELLQEERPNLLVISPGVPLKSDWIEKYRSAGGAITSELSLAAEFLEDELVIGVTGSMGKSTVCALLEAGIAATGKTCFLGGNFGTPLADYILEVLTKQRERADYIVLELSSFQLENCEGLELEYGVITAFAPNHLERYASLEEYLQTKWSLTEFSKRPIALNGSSSDLIEFAETHGKLGNYEIKQPTVDPRFKDAKILGAHNYQNLSFVAQILTDLGLSNFEKGLNDFAGLPHRLERVGEFGGRLFVNDSKATNIEAVVAAVNSLQMESRPIALLLGGRDKQLPWEKLKDSIKLVSKVIVFGEAKQTIVEKLGIKCEAFNSLAELMRSISAITNGGDIVLLSPGGTSLDEFKSFMDRGERFGEWAKSIV